MNVKSKILNHRAKALRNDMTEAEKYLWHALKSKQLGVKFRRQAPIGKFIVDFVSFEKRIVIEVDGGQHAEITQKQDVVRDIWLKDQGFTVLRFWNNEVLENRDGVLNEIIKHL